MTKWDNKHVQKFHAWGKQGNSSLKKGIVKTKKKRTKIIEIISNTDPVFVFLFHLCIYFQLKWEKQECV